MASSIRDLIQRIQLEGEQEVSSKLGRMAATGQASLEALGAAVAKLAAPFTKFQADTTKVVQAADAMGQGIRNLGASVGSFGARMGVAVGGVAVAGGAILAGALKVTTALRSIRDGLLEQRLAASQNAGETKKSVQTNFENANALEDLRLEYSKGKITSQQYNEQLRELTRTQERARQQALQLSFEQESIRKEQAKDQADVMRRTQMIQLETRFGSVLANELVKLATVLDRVRERFFAAFGPTVSGFLENVSKAIEANSDKFIALFQKTATSLADVFTKSKITIDGVVKGILSFAEEVARVIVGVVIPAFKALVSGLEVVAQFINSIFGTNFTASTLIAAALILKLIGIFGILGQVIGNAALILRVIAFAFGPVGLAIVALMAVIALLIPLIQSIDWNTVAETALKAWKSVKDIVVATLGAIVGAWTTVTNFFQTKINQIMGFFDNLIRKVKEFLGLTGDVSTGPGSLAADAGLGDISGFDSGGLFRGRPGIDKNLALLSDEEFIIKRKAVKHWGLGFMHAINNMRNPFRGFNAGGLVSPMMQTAPIASFAGGGLNRSSPGRPFVLQMKDGTEFSGMTIQEDTANNMGKYAARKSYRSGGPKPLWYGGGK